MHGSRIPVFSKRKVTGSHRYSGKIKEESARVRFRSCSGGPTTVDHSPDTHYEGVHVRPLLRIAWEIELEVPPLGLFLQAGLNAEDTSVSDDFGMTRLVALATPV